MTDRAVKIKDTCPSPLELEKVFFGLCSDPDIIEHVKKCPTCKKKIELLKNEQSVFLARRPTASFKARLQARLDTEREFFAKTAWKKFIPAAAAVFTAFFIWFGTQERRPVSPAWRAKGALAISFSVQKGRMIKRGISGMKVSAGDTLQIFYRSEKNGFLHLISVEKNGGIQMYVPSENVPPIKIISSHEWVPFPYGIKLDNSGKDELFLAVLSDKPIKHEKLKTLVKKHITTLKIEGKNIDSFIPLPIPAEQDWFIVRRGK